jgi:hypothetical protein
MALREYKFLNHKEYLQGIAAIGTLCLEIEKAFEKYGLEFFGIEEPTASGESMRTKLYLEFNPKKFFECNPQFLSQVASTDPALTESYRG